MKTWIFSIFCVAISLLLDTKEIEGILDITKENFYQKLTHSKKPILLNFYGDHCPSCHFLEPIFANLSVEYGKELQFARVNDLLSVSLPLNLKSKRFPLLSF